MSFNTVLRACALALSTSVACFGCAAEEPEVLDVQADGVDVKVKRSDQGVEIQVKDKDQPMPARGEAGEQRRR